MPQLLVAAEPPQGKISVNGIGTAEIKPDVAEVHTSVVGNATLAADAIKKYRENRRRQFELLHKSDVKGLVVEGRGPLVTSVTTNNNQQNGAVFFNFNGAGQANPQAVGMNCTESLVIRVPQIDRMKHEDVIDAVVKILDVCKDAGMIVASVEFKSSQMETHKACGNPRGRRRGATQSGTVGRSRSCPRRAGPLDSGNLGGSGWTRKPRSGRL